MMHITARCCETACLYYKSDEEKSSKKAARKWCIDHVKHTNHRVLMEVVVTNFFEWRTEGMRTGVIEE
jgi:hypothetical protein